MAYYGMSIYTRTQIYRIGNEKYARDTELDGCLTVFRWRDRTTPVVDILQLSVTFEDSYLPLYSFHDTEKFGLLRDVKV